MAQFYVSVVGSTIFRGPRELKGFVSVELAPGERRSVTVLLRRADLAYWDIRRDGWTVEGGDYMVSVGASSRDIRATATVAVDGDEVAIPLTVDSTIGELLDNPITAPLIRSALDTAFGAVVAQAVGGGDVVKMISPSTLRSVLGLLGEAIDPGQLERVMAAANAEGASTP